MKRRPGSADIRPPLMSHRRAAEVDCPPRATRAARTVTRQNFHGRRIAAPVAADSSPPAGRHTAALDETISACRDSQFVTALARGLAVLDVFRPGEGPLGNQRIAARTGLPRPTVVRLTHTLATLGYLVYCRRSHGYALGPPMLALGYAAQSDILVRRVARASMRKVADGLPGSVVLGGRDRRSMIWLETHHGPGAAAGAFDPGMRSPIAATAMGRACLAAVTGPERNCILDSIRRDGPDDWPSTRVGLEKAEREFAERGFCLSLDDPLPHACAVATALRSPDGETVYGLGISVRLDRVAHGRGVSEWGAALLVLAECIHTGLTDEWAAQMARHAPRRASEWPDDWPFRPSQARC